VDLNLQINFQFLTTTQCISSHNLHSCAHFTVLQSRQMLHNIKMHCRQSWSKRYLGVDCRQQWKAKFEQRTSTVNPLYVSRHRLNATLQQVYDQQHSAAINSENNIHSFSRFTLLAWHRRAIWPVKKLGWFVGGDDLTGTSHGV